MGWLLTIWLSLPLVESDLKIRMWFSRQSYCNFAKEKFTENPIQHSVENGIPIEAKVKKYECRLLRKSEEILIPPHMRN